MISEFGYGFFLPVLPQPLPRGEGSSKKNPHPSNFNFVRQSINSNSLSPEMMGDSNPHPSALSFPDHGSTRWPGSFY